MSPPCDPPFILPATRYRTTNYLEPFYYKHSTRSSSTESSASSTATLRHVDTLSSTPVVTPTK